MSDNPQAEMLEATRLTRAGRLTEATVLLQRRLAGMQRSDTATESAVRWRVPEALHVLFGRAAPIERGRAAPIFWRSIPWAGSPCLTRLRVRRSSVRSMPRRQ